MDNQCKIFPFSLLCTELHNNYNRINAAQWVQTDCVPFKNKLSTLCTTPANVNLVIDGEGAKPEECSWFRRTMRRC